MKSRWCQRGSLRRLFRGSNSVPFSDTFWVRTALAIGAATASPVAQLLCTNKAQLEPQERMVARPYAFTFRAYEATATVPPLGPAWAWAPTPGEARAHGLWGTSALRLAPF